LNDKNHYQGQQHQRKDQIAEQQARFMPKVLARRVLRALHLDVSIIIWMNCAERRWLVKSLSKHANQKEGE
jgi:DMSO reductase anchor subunit